MKCYQAIPTVSTICVAQGRAFIRSYHGSERELSCDTGCAVQETKKKATKAAAKPKADKPKPEKKRAAPAAKKETKKAKKDPNAPKRGLSAFMYFSNAKRDEVLSCFIFTAVHALLLQSGRV